MVYLVQSSLIAQPFLARQNFQAPDNHTYDRFGNHFFIKGDYLVTGAPNNKTDVQGGGNVPGAGAVYFYNLDEDTIWEFQQKLISPHRFNYETFGAHVGMSDSLLIAGAHFSHLDESQTNFLNEAGAAYIFKLDPSGIWNFSQKLTPKNRNEKDHFGSRVGLQEDVIAVGAKSHDYDSNKVYKHEAGSVFIFEKSGSGSFKEIQHLTPSDRDSLDGFGGELFLKNSNELFVGAPLQKGANYFEGAIYYYVRNSNGVWNEQQKITPDNRILGYFGLSISAWGDYLYVGASKESVDVSGQNFIFEAGGAYIFKKDHTGKYNQVQRIVAPVREHIANFGHKVSGSEDLLVVGAPYSSSDENNLDSITFTGAVYVYLKDKNDIWRYSQKLVQSPRLKYGSFGSHLLVRESSLLSCNVGSQTTSGTITLFRRKDSAVGFQVVKGTDLENINIFPNPSTGFFIIDAGDSVINRISIYDTGGRLVWENNGLIMNNMEIRFPESLLNGLYFIQLNIGSQIINRKVLLQRR